MNTNLLLALGCLQQAAVYVTKAENDLYLDDLSEETDNAISAVYSALSGCKDDVAAEMAGINIKPITDNVVYIGVNKE